MSAECIILIVNGLLQNASSTNYTNATHGDQSCVYFTIIMNSFFFIALRNACARLLIRADIVYKSTKLAEWETHLSVQFSVLNKSVALLNAPNSPIRTQFVCQFAQE